MDEEKEKGEVEVAAEKDEEAESRFKPKELGREGGVRTAEINAGEARVLRQKAG